MPRVPAARIGLHLTRKNQTSPLCQRNARSKAAAARTATRFQPQFEKIVVDMIDDDITGQKCRRIAETRTRTYRARCRPARMAGGLAGDRNDRQTDIFQGVAIKLQADEIQADLQR